MPKLKASQGDRFFGRMEVKTSASPFGRIGFERCASIPASNDRSLSELVAFAVTATKIGRMSFAYLCRNILVASYPYCQFWPCREIHPCWASEYREGLHRTVNLPMQLFHKAQGLPVHPSRDLRYIPSVSSAAVQPLY